jgi:hypothetical protein
VASWAETATGSVIVTVDYYDPKHADALNQYPTAPQIQRIVQNGVTIPIEEFLTHYMFHRTRFAPSSYSNYLAVRRRISAAIPELQDFATRDDNGDLYMSAEAQMLPPNVTQYIGESIGLSIANRIHDLTEADWIAIPETTKGKTLDYEYASDGARIIKLEAKGSVVDGNKTKSDSIYKHKTSIEDKKKADTANDPRSALRYGTIAAIPANAGRLRCWLLDPPPEDLDRDPSALRVIAHLEFLCWIVWLLSPRSQLAIVLRNRLIAIRNLRDPLELSGVALQQANGREFGEERVLALPRLEPHWFFATRSHVRDGPAGGVLSRIDDRTLMFIGIRSDLVDLAVAQDFGRIVDYKAEVASMEKAVICTVPIGEFSRLGISDEGLPDLRRTKGYVHFTLKGLLRYSREGLVFGALPIKDS